MSSAAGEESGAAAVPTQGPVPVERVKAANGLEKVVLREVRGNTVEVPYCPPCVSLPRFRLVGVSAVRSRYRSAAPAVAPGATSAIAAPIPIIFKYKWCCSGFSYARSGWIDREKPVMN
jgi:hypothetical protein